MRTAGTIGAAALLLAGAAAGAQTVKDGVDAWQRGDYATAVAKWRPLAERGDGDAAFDLGQAYKLGRGVPVDMAQAKSFYGQAARAGHPQAGANYGLLLFQDGDRRAAMPWIAKAADAGDPRAQYVFGTALFNGDVAARDWPRAYAMMTRAAAAGLPQATTSLAQMDRFLSAADRAKGTELARSLSTSAMPPMGRQAVTQAGAPVMPAPSASLPAPAQVAAAKPPKPSKVATPAPAKPIAALATGGAWQVQLGAFASEAAAKASWGTFTAKVPALRGLRPAYVRAGSVVRLRATGLADRAAADRACAAAKAAGGACFPVPAGS